MTEERKKPLDHKGRIIRVETRVKATPEQIYEAWADPEKIAHWSRWLRRLARPPLRHEGRETPHGKPEGTEQREGEMTQAKSASASRQQERKIKREIELNAPVKEVWKALTEPEELKRWFPLEARVVPGKGGKIFLSWGPECEAEAEIVAWEPVRKFAWQDQLAVVEWTLEARGGKTILRLVQSGFAGESDWEREWSDSTSFGWEFMLLSLQWALERHPGVARQVAWPRLKVRCTREEAYHRLMAPGGLFQEDASAALRAGQPYGLRDATGERFSGKAEFVQAPRGFCMSVSEMNDALLWLTIEGVPGKIEVQLWLSAFGVEEKKVLEFEKSWLERLGRVFCELNQN